MSCFLTNSSLGKKLVMSLTGCFLVLFILFHMSMNLVAIISPEGYNTICAFLGANWYALAGTVVLAAGVLIHFAYALWLTYNNYQARGKQRYEVTVTEPGVDWASKNMLVLGWIILAGLALHLFNFWAKMQLVEIMGGHENSLGFHPADGAALIQYTFSQWYYVVIYLLWFAALWFHLTHGGRCSSRWAGPTTRGTRASKGWPPSSPRSYSSASQQSSWSISCRASALVRPVYVNLYIN